MAPPTRCHVVPRGLSGRGGLSALGAAAAPRGAAMADGDGAWRGGGRGSEMGWEGADGSCVGPGAAWRSVGGSDGGAGPGGASSGPRAAKRVSPVGSSVKKRRKKDKRSLPDEDVAVRAARGWRRTAMGSTCPARRRAAALGAEGGRGGREGAVSGVSAAAWHPLSPRCAPAGHPAHRGVPHQARVPRGAAGHVPVAAAAEGNEHRGAVALLLSLRVPFGFQLRELKAVRPRRVNLCCSVLCPSSLPFWSFSLWKRLVNLNAKRPLYNWEPCWDRALLSSVSPPSPGTYNHPFALLL